MISKTIINSKTNKQVKVKLLNSLGENNEFEEKEINIANVIDPGETIGLIICYEKISKTRHKRITLYVEKQGEAPRKVKDIKNFFENGE